VLALVVELLGVTVFELVARLLDVVMFLVFELLEIIVFTPRPPIIIIPQAIKTITLFFDIYITSFNKIVNI
ncbi:MAG: hypothetical protein ACRCTZ_08380, partial [Sarcina sp.]